MRYDEQFAIPVGDHAHAAAETLGQPRLVQHVIWGSGCDDPAGGEQHQAVGELGGECQVVHRAQHG